MKICVVGTGYVGLVTGTCFAETGNDVVCMDVDQAKIDLLKQGQIPIFEPGLEEMVQRNLEEERLRFTSDLAEAVRSSLLIFIAVGTPQGPNGESDVRAVLQVARDVAAAMDGYRIVIAKSTVPVGTTDGIRKAISSLTPHNFDVVSNPEFLKEGAAIEDFMRPDRVVVGTDSEAAAEIMIELYSPFTRTGAPILVMDTRSAEMTKYAANAMLATRISFMNEMANLCESLGADIHWVRQAVGLDRRVGPSFLFPGVGFGGSCFPKDVSALVSTGEENGLDLQLVKAVQQVNRRQKGVLLQKILKFYASSLPAELEGLAGPDLDETTRVQRVGQLARCTGSGHLFKLPMPSAEARAGLIRDRLFAIWGLSFKPQTDDIRESPALLIIEELLKLGARIQAYDPQAMPEARRLLGDRIVFSRTNYSALEGADALLLVTEWNVFRNPDFDRMRRLLKFPVIFDGRNQYNPDEMRDLGFLYYAIGRP